jgi:hypothetical protein
LQILSIITHLATTRTVKNTDASHFNHTREDETTKNARHIGQACWKDEVACNRNDVILIFTNGRFSIAHETLHALETFQYNNGTRT